MSYLYWKLWFIPVNARGFISRGLNDIEIFTTIVSEPLQGQQSNLII